MVGRPVIEAESVRQRADPQVLGLVDRVYAARMGREEGPGSAPRGRLATRGRAALKERLWGEGVSDDLAEAWIARWESEAVRRGLKRDATYWHLAAEWIDEERGAS